MTATKISLITYILLLLLGNIFDHYDTSITSFLIPIIGRCFFADHGHFTTLIKGYSAIWSSVIGKSLGVVFFHFYLNKYGIRKSLICTLIGMSIVTFLFVLVPCNVEYLSAISFVILRIMQSFFAIGEYLICSIILIKILENKNIASSYYHFSTMLGIIIASFVTYLVSTSLINWRYAFVFGSGIGLLGIAIRYTKFDIPMIIASEIIPKSDYITKVICNNFKLVLVVSLLMSLSYFTYSFSFIFVNSIASQESDIYQYIVNYDYLWLCFDALLLLIFGKLFKKLNVNKLLAGSLLAFIILVPIAFILLYVGSSITHLWLAKLLILLLGVAYAIPMTCLTYSLCDDKYRYIVLGAGSIIGNDFIGKSFTPVMLYITKNYGIEFALIYPTLVILIAIFLVYKKFVVSNNMFESSK